MNRILVTGGAGYIGSHTVLELLNDGYHPVVIDDLSNSSEESLRRVAKITGKKPTFHQVNLLDKDKLDHTLANEPNIDGVIHFAAKKAVGESVEQPLSYYQNNVTGSLTLFELMNKHGISNLVFSSSATVYGDPVSTPIPETAILRPTNPYGHTKAMMEQILLDTAAACQWGVVLLRYFNPVGAHPSGLIGEDPEYPNNLLPFVSQVAAGIREKVTIFGDDYPTPDGTGVRDYIHITDLALAHLKSLEYLQKNPSTSSTFNIGTGRGYSVKEMIEAFRRISGRKISVETGPRRAGDIAECIADPTLANNILKWQATRDLSDMVSSAWNWQIQNPNGYRTPITKPGAVT